MESILLKIKYKNSYLKAPCVFIDDTIDEIKKKLFRYDLNFIPSITKVTKLSTHEITVEKLTDVKEEELLGYVEYKDNGYSDLTETDYTFVIDYISKNKQKVINYLNNLNKPVLDKDIFPLCDISLNKDIYSQTITDTTIYWESDKDTSLKLFEIFNFLPLSEEVPLSAIGKKWTKTDKNYAKYYHTFDEQAFNSRKKYKGFHLKMYDYDLDFSFNGTVYLHSNLQVDSIDTFVNQKLDIINNLIKYINSKDTFFTGVGRLSLLSSTNYKVKNITSILKTSYIDRELLKIFCKKDTIKEELKIAYKQTSSQAILSLLYNDIITINIAEDFDDTSVIKILNCQSLQQLEIIKWKVLGCWKISQDTITSNVFGKTDAKFKTKTTKKELKEKNVQFDSRECQSIRQPKLTNESVPMDKENVIFFNNNLYICNHPTYPHPGFTKNNVVCCFKNNQKGNEKYIKNMDKTSLEITIQPSNYIHNGKNLLRLADKTYAVLIDSKLKPVQNEEFDKLEENIWLNPVTLADIIYMTNKNKCSNHPDLTKTDSLKCSIHKKHKHFGYNIKGLPCCYDKIKLAQVVNTVKNNEQPENLQYIIKIPTKILNYKQIGVLPELFSDIFGKNYYRLGIKDIDVDKYRLSDSHEVISIRKDDSTNGNYIIDCTWKSFKKDTFIVLLTTNNITDLIINIVDNTVKKIHLVDSPLVEFLKSFVNKSCKISVDYPETYQYKQLVTEKFYQDNLKEEHGKIISNIVDKNLTILYLLTSKGILLPVLNKSTHIEKTILFEKFLEKQIFYPLTSYLYILQTLKINENIKFIKTDIKGIVGVITSFGRVVPVKNDQQDIKFDNGIFITKLNNVVRDNVTFINEYTPLKISYKQILTNSFTPSVKENIKKIVKQPLSLSEKADVLYKILENYIPGSIVSEVLQSIVLEIINDNKEQLLINGIILENDNMVVNILDNEKMITF